MTSFQISFGSWCFCRLGLRHGAILEFLGLFFSVLKQVPINFSYLGECCYTDFQQSSRNVVRELQNFTWLLIGMRANFHFQVNLIFKVGKKTPQTKRVSLLAHTSTITRRSTTKLLTTKNCCLPNSRMVLHKFAANHEGKRTFPLISDVLMEHVARLTHWQKEICMCSIH